MEPHFERAAQASRGDIHLRKIGCVTNNVGTGCYVDRFAYELGADHFGHRFLGLFHEARGRAPAAIDGA